MSFPIGPSPSARLAISTGAMNMLGSLIGAVPMCHGAGGMSAQVSFGARTRRRSDHTSGALIDNPRAPLQRSR